MQQCEIVGWIRVLCVPVMLAGWLTGCGNPEVERKRAVESSLAYFQQGEYSKANLEIKNLAHHLPDSIKNYDYLIMFSRALDAYSQNDYYHALSFCASTLRMNPAFSEAFAMRSLAQVGLGDSDQAYQEISQAIRLAPLNSRYYLQRGNVWILTDRYNYAVEDYNQAISLDPQAIEPQFKRGLVYFGKQDYKIAVREFSAILDRDPKRADVYLRRGEAYSNCGMLLEALADLDSALVLNPGLGETYFIKGRIFEQHGDFEPAIAMYRQFIEQTRRDSMPEKYDEARKKISQLKSQKPRTIFLKMR